MDLNTLKKSTGEVLTGKESGHWTHNVAAAGLVAGAILLITGRKRQALAVAAGSAAFTLLERPEAAQEFWAALPNYIHAGQDFLVRTEGFIERASEQIARIKETIARQV